MKSLHKREYLEFWASYWKYQRFAIGKRHHQNWQQQFFKDPNLHGREVVPKLKLK